MAGLSFIIQNEKEVIRKFSYQLIYIAWKRTIPMSTSELNSYISIKFISVITSIGGHLGGHQRVRVICISNVNRLVHLDSNTVFTHLFRYGVLLRRRLERSRI